jgi:transcriptional regulator with XRE-family HTH domain
MTQDHLADKLFVSRQLVSKWELGFGMPTIDHLLNLTKLFHISFEELLCLDETCEIDESNLFRGHDRLFIINGIIRKKMKVNLPEVFYQFSSSERIMLLKAIKEDKLKVSMNEILPRLTPGEIKFLKMEDGTDDITKSSQ